ncbi:MAG: hypothetical protein IK093_18960 [Ruminiclostridium sp.]|nr:hypothetical protein [Ruminiclostridium sp.]
MQFKKGNYWKACFDEENDRYTAEYGDSRNYNLYEITKEIYDKLDESVSHDDAVREIYKTGRHLYMSVDDRCGPPYTIVFDHDYENIAPWANVVENGKVWPDELTDAAVEIFESEKDNREQRRRRREQRESEEN